MALRWSPLMGILRDVAAGMLHVHSANICHGDLSPMNILLKYDESAHENLQDALNACTVQSKIADFGLAITLAATCTHVSNAARAPRSTLHRRCALPAHNPFVTAQLDNLDALCYVR